MVATISGTCYYTHTHTHVYKEVATGGRPYRHFTVDDVKHTPPKCMYVCMFFIDYNSVRHTW